MASNLFPRGNIYEDSGGIFSDWKGIIDDGTLISRNDETSDGSTATLYTVPAGKILYVLSATLSYRNETDPAGGSFCRLRFLELPATNRVLLFMASP